MDARIGGIVSAGLGIIIFLIMMTTVTWDVQVVENYVRYEFACNLQSPV